MKDRFRKSILICSLAVVTILLVSSFSAAITIKKDKDESDDIDERKILKDEIILTNDKLPILRIAEKQLTNDELKNKISNIIEIIESNGFINEKETKKILGSSGGIYSGEIDLYASDYASINGCPGFGKGLIPFWLLVSWDVSSCSQIWAQYGHESYDGVPHTGLSFLGLGIWKFFIHDGSYFDAEIHGVSVLTIIST